MHESTFSDSLLSSLPEAPIIEEVDAVAGAVEVVVVDVDPVATGVEEVEATVAVTGGDAADVAAAAAA